MNGHNQRNPVSIQEVNIPDPQLMDGGKIGMNADVQGGNVSQQNRFKEANNKGGNISQENGNSFREENEIKITADNEDGTVNHQNINRFVEDNEIKVTADNEDGTVTQKNRNRFEEEENQIKVIADTEEGNGIQQNKNVSNKDWEMGGNSNIQGSNVSEQNSSWLEYISKDPDNNLQTNPKENDSNDYQNNSESFHLEKEASKKKKKGLNVAKLSYYFNSELQAMNKRVDEEVINQSYPEYYENEVALDHPQDVNWNHANHTWNEVDPHLYEVDPHLNEVYPHLRSTKPQNFMVYKQRWAIVITLALLNFSNALLWINVAPVSNIAAAYFKREEWEINLFSIIFMIVTIPFTFIATYITKKTNIRIVMHTGALLNAVGATIRAAAMVHSLDINVQFYLSILGQTICAMALSFLLYLPTKVAHSWFPETQRVLATTIGSIANPIGIIAINIVAPIIVDTTDQFPIINYVCVFPALLAETMVTICVNRSYPPTPPSEVARQETREDQHQRRNSHPINLGYGTQLCSALCNIAYFLLVLPVGGGLGFVTSLSTVTQQMLCTVGYSDVVSGLSIACMFLFGFVGAAVITTYASRTGFLINIAKVCWAGCAIFGIFMMEMYLIPNQAVLLCIFSSLFGFFSVGSFSIGLELAVEATYPVEPAITTGIIYFWGQILAVVVILLVSALSHNISYSDNSVCSEDVQLKDFTSPILVLMVLLTVVTCISIIFFKTSYKRRDAERQKLNSET